MGYLCKYQKNDPNEPVSIEIPGSKSQSNRMLMLAHQKRANLNLIQNLSDSRDTQLLLKALQKLDLLKNEIEKNVDYFQWSHYQLQEDEVSDLSNHVSNQLQNEKFDMFDAGTPARMLLAYFSALGIQTQLTGNKSLQNRSMQPLIDVLESGGAKFEFHKEPGYFPLSITRGLAKFPSKKIDRSISSQYVSSMMLIAPIFSTENKIEFEGHEHSQSYIEMTKKCMEDCGIQITIVNNSISILSHQFKFPNHFIIEADWSSASYFYSVCALRPNSNLLIPYLKENSCQGDSACAEFFIDLGVTTVFNQSGCTIAQNISHKSSIDWDLSDVPDLAPTLIATACALDITGKIKGIQNLIYKESNRIESINQIITQLGYIICESSEKFDEYFLQKTEQVSVTKILNVKTHSDHRIAMAFATLSTKIPVLIDDVKCVEKSFPNFWNELKKCNFEINPYESE